MWFYSLKMLFILCYTFFHILFDISNAQCPFIKLYSLKKHSATSHIGMFKSQWLHCIKLTEVYHFVSKTKWSLKTASLSLTNHPPKKESAKPNESPLCYYSLIIANLESVCHMSAV